MALLDIHDIDVTLTTIGEVKVTKLPPGEAEGAGDLQRWAMRRLSGRSGLPLTRKERERADKKRRRDAAECWLAKAEKKQRRKSA